MRPAVLMLEFNELSPSLMSRFITQGHLPAFERLRSRSATFVTEAGESGDALNPWVQWVTAHTGATAEEHGITRLGDAQLLKLPTLADVISESGGVVWQCGSMNVAPVAPINGALLPDPWSVEATPQPADLTPFFRFVSANVQEHTNEASPLSRRETADFVRFLASHGISARTVLATARQLVGERVGRLGRWHRAELLDRFQWDVFRHYYRRLRPTFATFFSNSTAHFQHLHWDEMERDPERSAVLHGYKQMDRLVQSALDLADDRTTVVLCTALSQTANVDPDRAREGFYRPRDADGLLRALGIVGVDSVVPVMAEQAHVFFVDEAAARHGEVVLGSAMSGGEPTFDVHRLGHDVFIGCRFFVPRPTDESVVLPNGLTVPFHGHFYWTDAPREGTHHPDGILWIGPARSAQDDARVPLTALAPTLLSILDIDAPPSMPSAPLLLGATR